MGALFAARFLSGLCRPQPRRRSGSRLHCLRVFSHLCEVANIKDRVNRIVRNESPEVIAALMADMAEHIELQKKTIARLEEEKAQKDQAAFNLEERVKLLRRALFGRSSETRAEASDRPRDKSQEEALLFSQAQFPAPVTRDEAQKGKAKGAGLEERVIEHGLSSEALAEESSSRGINGKWIATGLFDESTKIQIIERRYIREVHRRMKYKFVPASGSEAMEKDVIVTAPGAPELLPGMSYTTEFAASVVADKYISHVPLERQTREMESLGLSGMKNSTLSRLSALAAAALEPLQEKILRQDLIPSELALHVDETPWNIQNKHEKDGYMWTISSRSGSYYFFKPSRSAKVVSEKLAGYSGPVVTDGFRSYDEVLKEAKIPHAYCWAHARREFLPLENHDPTIKPILDLIDKMFEVEREARSFDELVRLRAEKTNPIAMDLKSLLLHERGRPESRSGSQKRKAIEYTLTRWEGLTLFLTDQRVPLSNNEAERTIRHPVTGRKNYYGAGSHSGAETAATLFTVIESAKKNDLDPRSFLIMSLERAARREELETPLAYARRTRSGQHAE